MSSKFHNPVIWSRGWAKAEAFCEPTQEMVYLINAETAPNHGFVVLSIFDLESIIAAMRARSAEARRSPAPNHEDIPF